MQVNQVKIKQFIVHDVINRLINLFLGSYLEHYFQEYISKKLLQEYLVFGDKSRLEIAETAIVNNALFNLSSGKIIIEDYVFFGHNVSLITGTHDYNKFGKERQNSIPESGRNILIKQGVWIASNVTILGPCIIGENSVVAAGALVKGNVPPYTLVAGLPAKPIKQIKNEVLESQR